MRAQDAAGVDDGDRRTVLLSVPSGTLGLHLALGVRAEGDTQRALVVQSRPGSEQCRGRGYVDDAGATGFDRRVQDRGGADPVLPPHPVRIAAPVGERGGGVDGPVAAARRLPRCGGVGHVPGHDVDARVVRVHADQREVLAQLRRRPHERPDLMALAEQAFEDVDAEEPGRT